MVDSKLGKRLNNYPLNHRYRTVVGRYATVGIRRRSQPVIQIMLTITNNASATFPVGATTVTWTATDAMAIVLQLRSL